MTFIENEKIYIDKGNLTNFVLWPIPENLDDWIVIDFEHEYNYVGKTYNAVTREFYNTPLTDAKLREEFKAEREATVASLTVEFDGKTFDADEESQNRMLRPIAALQNDTDTWLWVLTDNTVVHLTRPQFIAVLTLAGKAQTAVWVQEEA